MSESTDDLLRSIQRILDEIKSLFILTNQDILAKKKKLLLPKDSIKKKIYELCDGTRTTSEIAKSIERDNKYVNSYLSILRREGLIRTVEREGKLL